MGWVQQFPDHATLVKERKRLAMTVIMPYGPHHRILPILTIQLPSVGTDQNEHCKSPVDWHLAHFAALLLADFLLSPASQR